MADPITPPPELVQQWWAEENHDPFGVAVSNLANRAAQWGADAELEECCEWLYDKVFCEPDTHSNLRATRRPKPPSLKEQALETLKYPKDLWSQSEVDIIRRALEALDD